MANAAVSPGASGLVPTCLKLQKLQGRPGDGQQSWA